MAYEVEDRYTNEVLSRHRTRQGAVDTWRQRHAGRAVRIYRRQANGVEVPIVEGTWHEAKRGD